MAQIGRVSSALRCCRSCRSICSERRRRPLDARVTREIVADYLPWQVVVNDGDSILEALDLEARYQVSFWDALVIQAAQVAGAEVLYSEDLSDGQRYGTVRVKNPLTGDE